MGFYLMRDVTVGEYSFLFSQRLENEHFDQANKRNSADVSETLRASNWTAAGTVGSASSRPEQCTVEVTGLPPGASEDLVLNYFENARRSKGGPVSTVVINPDSEKCLVTFESREGRSGDLTRFQVLCLSCYQNHLQIIFDPLTDR